jgi:TonB family protein
MMSFIPSPAGDRRSGPIVPVADLAPFAALIPLVVLSACGPESSPVLVDESAIQVREAVGAESEQGPVDLRAEPTFTPFTDAPTILNRDEVVATMTREYPPLLRDAGIGGTTQVYFLIDEEGVVEQVRLDESSGHEALDTAALNVAGAFRFSPALNGEEPVPVWVSFPITFQVR